MTNEQFIKDHLDKNLDDAFDKILSGADEVNLPLISCNYIQKYILEKYNIELDEDGETYYFASSIKLKGVKISIVIDILDGNLNLSNYNND